MDTLSATLLLLTIMDPLGNVATFVAGLRPVPLEKRLRVCSPAIARVLKERGSLDVEHLMGMLLVMVAVQMFLNGIEHYLKH